MNRGTVLLADDDKSIRSILTEALARHSLEVRATGNASTLWRWLVDGHGDVVVSDVYLPDESILNLLPRIRKLRPELNVVVMSAHHAPEMAARAAQRGAASYLSKPFDLDHLVRAVEQALEPEEPGSGARAPMADEPALALLGNSPAMRRVFDLIARLAKTELPILITGQPGTGKHTVARAIHRYSSRAKAPLQILDPTLCLENGFAEQLSISLENAVGGTVVIPHLDRLAGPGQDALMRMTHTSAVAGEERSAAGIRWIATANSDLSALVRQGRFREDLHYRFSAAPLPVPSLQERQEDLPDLVRHFLMRAARDGLPECELSDAVIARLAEHDWPDNLRGLDLVIRRLCTAAGNDSVSLAAVDALLEDARSSDNHQTDDTPPEDEANRGLGALVHEHLSDYFAAHADGLPPPGLHERIIQEVERPLLRLTLDATRGNQLKAADVLGLNRNTLRKKIRLLDIPVTRGGK